MIIKPNTNNLSAEEGGAILTFVKAAIDLWVKHSGGKPSFGNKGNDK